MLKGNQNLVTRPIGDTVVEKTFFVTIPCFQEKDLDNQDNLTRVDIENQVENYILP